MATYKELQAILQLGKSFGQAVSPIAGGFKRRKEEKALRKLLGGGEVSEKEKRDLKQLDFLKGIKGPTKEQLTEIGELKGKITPDTPALAGPEAERLQYLQALREPTPYETEEVERLSALAPGITSKQAIEKQLKGVPLDVLKGMVPKPKSVVKHEGRGAGDLLKQQKFKLQLLTTDVAVRDMRSSLNEALAVMTKDKASRKRNKARIAELVDYKKELNRRLFNIRDLAKDAFNLDLKVFEKTEEEVEEEK